jgi:hypothetical protein
MLERILGRDATRRVERQHLINLFGTKPPGQSHKIKNVFSEKVT